MTAPSAVLIEEQKQRQRLENEISIAREVQDQLFQELCRTFPREIEAICKAARAVSGDYYDFIQLSPTHLAIAIADISEKEFPPALPDGQFASRAAQPGPVDGSERMTPPSLSLASTRHFCVHRRTIASPLSSLPCMTAHTQPALHQRRPSPFISHLQDSALHLDKAAWSSRRGRLYAYEKAP